MAEDIRALLTRWFDEVWNRRRLETIDEIMAPDAVAHGFPTQGASVNGLEFKKAIQQFQQTFSQIHISIEDLLVDDTKAAVRWRASAIHSGVGLGFPATDETVEITGITIVVVKNGKIVEGWDAYDLTQGIQRLRQVAEQRAGAPNSAANQAERQSVQPDLAL